MVEGATGAIVVATDGDAVQWYCDSDSERLRLRGAYVAVELRAARAAAIRGKLSGVKSLVLEYEGSTLIAQEIDEDCFVVLELGHPPKIGQGTFRLKSTVENLRRAITR